MPSNYELENCSGRRSALELDFQWRSMKIAHGYSNTSLHQISKPFFSLLQSCLVLERKTIQSNFWASFVKSFFPQTVWSSGEGATWFVVFVHHDDYGWWQSMLVILPALLIESRAAKPREIPLCHCISASSIIKRLESSRPNFQKPKQLFISFQNFVKRDLSWN